MEQLIKLNESLADKANILQQKLLLLKAEEEKLLNKRDEILKKLIENENIEDYSFNLDEYFAIPIKNLQAQLSKNSTDPKIKEA
jgi:hypothetical protein